MLAVLVLMLGAIAIAGLAAVEIEKRTATAVLVTPASTGDLLAAKLITGTLLGASQALLFLLCTWSFDWGVTPLLLLGAAMPAALGLIARPAGSGSASLCAPVGGAQRHPELSQTCPI